MSLKGVRKICWGANVCTTARKNWTATECFLLLGIRQTNYELFPGDRLLVDPFATVPMTLQTLPALHLPADPRMVGLSEDRFIPGLQRLTEKVHQHGARIAIQLNHGGKNSQPDVAAGRPVLVPSLPKHQEMDYFGILTPEEIATFVAAAGPDGKGF